MATAAKSKPKSAKTKHLEKTAQALLAARDRGKEAYAEADGLMEQLLGQMKPGQVIQLPGGRTAELVDNFATRNKVFKQAGVARFDLKVSNA